MNFSEKVIDFLQMFLRAAKDISDFQFSNHEFVAENNFYYLLQAINYTIENIFKKFDWLKIWKLTE